MTIKEIDYYEKDALLEIDGIDIYFQFNGEEPTIEDAIRYLIKEVRRQYES